MLGGYLPESIGGTRLGTITVKYGYYQWRLKKRFKGHNLEFIPLSVGLNLIKTWGEHIEREWAPHYPNGYYPWNPSMNYAIYIGSGVDYLANHPRKWYRAVGMYYEVGLTSRLVEFWWDNKRTINFMEMWNLSVGVNVSLR